MLAEKGLQHDREKHKFAREFKVLADINPCLLLPVYIDDAVQLLGLEPDHRVSAQDVS